MKLTIEQAAEVAHEVNKAYCESIGDKSQLSWADSGEWQRTNAINGINFYVDQMIPVTPEVMHNNWMRQLVANGWIYGVKKSTIHMTHPCIRPYSELPEEQKIKDYLFCAVARMAKNEDGY